MKDLNKTSFLQFLLLLLFFSKHFSLTANLPTPNPTEEYHACLSSPCYEGSTCIDLPDTTFTCICNLNATGPLCESELFHKRFDVPAFSGHSFVQLKPLKAYHKLSIEIEFQTYSSNGIILYDQQRADGTGDFVSLALVNGFVEFKYNLGNGPVTITSIDRVQMKKFHKIIVKRYHRDGLLKLDDEEDVAGQTRGKLKALDLVEDTFIGYVPSNFSRVFENIGTHQGLIGCIRKIKIGRRLVELEEKQDDLVIHSVGLSECGENPCSSMPCQNGGTCHASDSKLYRCKCSPQYTGDFCENIVDPCKSNPCKIDAMCKSHKNGKYSCKCPPNYRGRSCDKANDNSDLTVPKFDGSSYIKFPPLEEIEKTFVIEIWFLTMSANGLILYNGQMKTGRGDFISLNLVNGFIQFRYNLGSGIANITSAYPISLDEWHIVKITRNKREGTLQIDNSTVFRGYSGPRLTELNLGLPFYIGSLKTWSEIHRLSGAYKGFKGAVQRLLVNNQPFPILGKLKNCSFTNYSTCSHKIDTYNGLPCPADSNPCLNNGVCLPNLNTYVCQCKINFTGKNCEASLNDNLPSLKFLGATFLEYRNRGTKSSNHNQTNDVFDDDIDDDDTLTEEETETTDDAYYDYEGDDYYNDDLYFYDLLGGKGERGNRYEIKLRTSTPNGLLLWRSKSRSLRNDYLSLAIVDGYPEFSFNLGKQEVFWSIRSRNRIDDGEWHIIQVRRRKRVGFISVDGAQPVRGVAAPKAITLLTNSKLWLGGAPSLPSGLPQTYYEGFRGCIEYVNVNAKSLNLLRPSDPNIIHFCHDNEI